MPRVCTDKNSQDAVASALSLFEAFNVEIFDD